MPRRIKDPGMTIEAELLEAQSSLYDAMMRKDAATLEAMLHPDLIFVHSSALVESRGAYLASVAANRYRYDSIVAEPGIISVYGETAIMSGVVHLNSTLHVQGLLVWKQEGGRWLLLVRHGAKIPDA
jgi:ketosteroid isomerase-like protein